MKNGLLLALLGALVIGCNSSSSENTAGATPGTPPKAADKKTIAFVTNNASDFWTIARKGTEKAESELTGYKVQFEMPQDGTAARQTEILETLVANGVAGIAVSPKDPANMKDLLNKIASKTLLFCQDSDAAETDRACYLGTDNVAAGVMAGEELKKALPNGGKVMVFVGSKDAQNAKERFEGLQKAIAGSKVTVIDIRTDEADHAKAKQNVADTIVNTPDLAACVGLWSYNGPAIVSAIKDAKKEGKIQVVCFDEEEDTLQGVKDGVVYGTIVQQPYEFGYQSVMMIAKVLDGDKSGIPADKKIIVPTKVVNKANVEEFATQLKELKGK
jgi:ribose transport system substrate-binding protein